jgi:hypothetical protein
MTLTISYISEKFEKYNNLYFNGSLKTPKFKISNSKRALGTLSISRRLNFYGGYTKEHTISISKYYDRTEKQYDNTLIHEMIHLYISQNDIIDNGSHGRHFKAECARINKYGWDLSRTTDVSGWKLSEEAQKRLDNKLSNATYEIIVYQMYDTDNTQFIFKVAKGKALNYYNHLKYKCKAVKVKYFKSNDNIFESLPTCRCRIRGRRIDKNDMVYKNYMI